MPALGDSRPRRDELHKYACSGELGESNDSSHTTVLPAHLTVYTPRERTLEHHVKTKKPPADKED